MTAVSDSDWPMGLRATRATRTLAALCRARPGARWSEADVEQALMRCGVQVNRVTVYRLLERFTRAGWLVRVVDNDRITRYLAQPPVRPRPAPVAPMAAAECGNCHAPLELPAVDASVRTALQALQAALDATPPGGGHWGVALRGQCARCGAPDPV